jgi:rod shape determining protein RodA
MPSTINIGYWFNRFISRFDGWLLAFMFALIALGLVVLYSASGQDMDRVADQVRNIGFALVVMCVVAHLSPQRLEQIAVPLYVLGVILLIGVALFGEVINGARRWLNLGVTRIQPSELMKIALPLMLAWYFQKREGRLHFWDFGVAALILAIPAALIVRQPDLGTALLVSAAGIYLLFLAGLSWKLIIGLGVIAGASLPLVWSMLHDYQRQRVLTLLDPSQDPLGAGYHIIQATIAIGSGGSVGKGWLNGTQAHLDFLPERTTDFIFAVFGEEFGLAGNLSLLVVYMCLIGRGLFIALRAATPFSRLLAGSITTTFFTYVFVNMGMVSGILPVVGVPLPLISYGGTSMVTILLGLGMLMSVYAHRPLVKS